MNPPKPSGTCPRCGAGLSPYHRQCRSCHSVLEPIAQAGGLGSFQLDTLLLMITLLSVILALLMSAPAIGVMICFVSLSAFVRSATMRKERQESLDRPLRATEKLLLFVESLVIVFGGAVAVIIITTSSCWIGMSMGVAAGGQGANNALGVLAAATLGGLGLFGGLRLVRLFWRKRFF